MQQIVISPTYTALLEQVKELPEWFDQLGELIHDSRNQIRLWPQADGRVLNVKRYHVPMLPNRFVYGFVRSPKARRAYDYALRVRSLGLDTPAPVAYLLCKQGGMLHESFLVTEQCPYPRNFYEFGFHGLQGREDVVRAFARFAAQLHEAGVYHRDFSPGNILFDRVDGEWRFCIVDINRMSFGPVGLRRGCKNFARLWGGSEFFRLVATEYAAARGFDAERCVSLVLKYRERFWKNRHRSYTDYD